MEGLRVHFYYGVNKTGLSYLRICHLLDHPVPRINLRFWNRATGHKNDGGNAFYILSISNNLRVQGQQLAHTLSKKHQN